MWLNKGLHLSKQLHRLIHSVPDYSTTEAGEAEKKLPTNTSLFFCDSVYENKYNPSAMESNLID